MNAKSSRMLLGEKFFDSLFNPVSNQERTWIVQLLDGRAVALPFNEKPWSVLHMVGFLKVKKNPLSRKNTGVINGGELDFMRDKAFSWFLNSLDKAKAECLFKYLWMQQSDAVQEILQEILEKAIIFGKEKFYFSVFEVLAKSLGYSVLDNTGDQNSKRYLAIRDKGRRKYLFLSIKASKSWDDIEADSKEALIQTDDTVCHQKLMKGGYSIERCGIAFYGKDSKVQFAEQ